MGQVIIPANGEVFELTLQSPIDGLEFVRLFSGDSADGWCYYGQPMADPFTRRFKLEGAGYCNNLKDVRAKLTLLGGVPQGQWMYAFHEAYSRNDYQGPIGVADPSWRSFPRPAVGSHLYFPALAALGGASSLSPYFFWASSNRETRWRWLVEVK